MTSRVVGGGAEGGASPESHSHALVVYVHRRQFWELERRWFIEWIAEAEEAWREGLDDA